MLFCRLCLGPERFFVAVGTLRGSAADLRVSTELNERRKMPGSGFIS
jgi:hypothetical protein